MGTKSTTIHGVLVNVFDEGVLILGKSGIGKSECALDLINRHHQLIADDSVSCVKTQENELLGRAHVDLPYYMSLRGVGIINVQEIFGRDHVCPQSTIDLVIELTDHMAHDVLGLDNKVYTVLGVKVKLLQIPASPQKNLANIIEVAVKNEKLKEKGIDSAQILHSSLKKKLTTPLPCPLPTRDWKYWGRGDHKK